MGNRYDMMEDSYGLFGEDMEAPEELNLSGGRHPNPWASEVGDHLQAEGVRRSLERSTAARFHLVRDHDDDGDRDDVDGDGDHDDIDADHDDDGYYESDYVSFLLIYGIYFCVDLG